MSEMKLRTYPDPVLRKKTDRVNAVGPEERAILDEMAKTMYMTQGVGLAATQVGLNKQFAVINIGHGLIKMVNPVITKREGEEAQEEGCLSAPGVTVKVKRAKRITVQYLNETGEVCQLKAEGLLSRAIQHEVDHLSGTVIIDYLHPLKRAIIKRKLTKNKAKNAGKTRRRSA